MRNSEQLRIVGGRAVFTGLVVGAMLFATGALGAEARLTWLGHAAFHYVAKSGQVFLIDPWMTNPKAPKDFKVDRADAILVTHGHSDHVGESFALARKTGALLIASYELAEIARKNGVTKLQPLNPQGSVTVGDVTVTAVSAVHSSSYQEGKATVYAGAPLGFVLAEPGAPTLYHAGDTGVFSDMALVGELYHPEIALVPIGGVYTMKPFEAAAAARLLKARAVVPMHFGTFPALAGTPEQLKEEMQKTQAPGKMRELKIGAAVNVSELF